VTWSTPANPLEDFGEDMGWGAVIVEEADEHKKKFEVGFYFSSGKIQRGPADGVPSGGIPIRREEALRLLAPSLPLDLLWHGWRFEITVRM
jgi:hypothetical protein